MKKYFSKDKWKFSFYCLTHPADGFYEIRHRNRGSVPIALIYVVLYALCYSWNRLGASFIVNDTNPRNVDAVSELFGVLLLFLLICVGNWSITCLMSGEGRLKDIAIIVGYSLLPMILTLIPATIISKIVAQNEEAFYYIIVYLGTAYSLLLMLIGIMTIHNYTLLKTLITVVLTVVAMLIIIFCAMMIFSLVSQVVGFFQSIYTELLFR
ncbi:MAG: Yip1 family protein [Lachnospiraceae bacterium]|nr:Yip1 family protein [Lachnospiraceae bacterium]